MLLTLQKFWKNSLRLIGNKIRPFNRVYQLFFIKLIINKTGKNHCKHFLQLSPVFHGPSHFPVKNEKRSIKLDENIF